METEVGVCGHAGAEVFEFLDVAERRLGLLGCIVERGVGLEGLDGVWLNRGSVTCHCLVLAPVATIRSKIPSGCLAHASSGLMKPQKVPSSGVVGQEPADDTVDDGVFEVVLEGKGAEDCPLSLVRLTLFGVPLATATPVTAAPPEDEAEAALYDNVCSTAAIGGAV